MKNVEKWIDVARVNTNLSRVGQHFRDFGQREGRNPSLFNHNDYLGNNPDVAAQPEIEANPQAIGNQTPGCG